MKFDGKVKLNHSHHDEMRNDDMFIVCVLYLMRGCISKESKINNEKKERELEAHAFDLINK